MWSGEAGFKGGHEQIIIAISRTKINSLHRFKEPQLTIHKTKKNDFILYNIINRKDDDD